ALDLPLSNAIPALVAAEKASEAFKSQRHSVFLDLFKSRRMSLLDIMGMPSWHATLSGEAKIVAYTRATRAALAVERWRLAHEDRFPDTLSELVPTLLPGLPIDPFDEKLLRYKKTGHGYIIYSIGPDFTDDNGKEQPANAKESDHYDIVFSVER